MGPAARARRRPAPDVDQEQEVRAKLYAKPPATERTVEVLGPAPRLVDRPPPDLVPLTIPQIAGPAGPPRPPSAACGGSFPHEA